MTEIEDFYERYAGDVRRFAFYLCGDIAMADEITSDTFVGAWMASAWPRWARPPAGERPLGIATTHLVVRREPVPYARPAVIRFHPWPYRFSDGSRRLARGVRLELGRGPLVPIFRAPALAHSHIGGCDLFYTDPHTLRLALCARRRASSGVRHRLDLGGTDLGGVFPAARWLGLLIEGIHYEEVHYHRCPGFRED